MIDGQTRRDLIVKILREASRPVKGLELAARCGVSRQIIVGDIALLRAAGTPISSTPRGYRYGKQERKNGVQKFFLCSHGPEMVARELYAIVDNGGTVCNVVVEHDVYGVLEGELNLKNRQDVEDYLQRMRATKAPLLAQLSGGLHAHLVEAKTEEELVNIRAALKKLGILAMGPKLHEMDPDSNSKL